MLAANFMASKFNQTASPNPVTRTASVPIVKHSYDSEPIYDDVIEVKKMVPPPVAARPKSPNTKQRNTPVYGNVENTIRRLPPPVVPKRTTSATPPAEQRNTLPAANKSEQQVTERRNTLPAASKEQQVSPVTEHKNTSYNNANNVSALAKEFTTKHLQRPPVATKPKQQMSPARSPVTERKNSPLYNNNASTVTEPLHRVPSPVIIARLEQQVSPVTKQRNSPLLQYDDTASTQSITEEEGIPLYGYYGNTAQNFFPEHFTPPITKQSSTDLYSTNNSEHGETELSHPVCPLYYDYVDCKTPNSPIMHERRSHDHALETVQPQGFSAILRQPQNTEASNKAYLQSLSCNDILHLLDNMNLSQHKVSFQEEQVDGMILATLTRDDLKELGVTKGVQLKRLLHLIEGIKSAKDLLENDYYT